MSTIIPSETPHTSAEFQHLASLVARGKNGEADVLPHLQRYVDEHPELLRMAGDLTQEVQATLINYIAKGDASHTMALSRHIGDLKTQIAGEQPSVLEELLAEEIIVAYLNLRYCDMLVARHSTNLTSIDLRRLDQANSRLTRSIQALGRLRKMGPLVQINIGQQVNLTTK